MKDPRPFIQIRRRKLGVLIYDSRLSARRGLDECAAAIGVSPEEFKAFETGKFSPSLPQVELLARFLNVPLEHFWGSTARSTAAAPAGAPDHKRILGLRNRVIGASLRLARTNKNLTQAELSLPTGITSEQLQRYETGSAAIPIPELEILAAALDTAIEKFADRPAAPQQAAAPLAQPPALAEIPLELREFVAKPVNRPYLEIARRLSDLPVDKLRQLAENLLEITY